MFPSTWEKNDEKKQSLLMLESMVNELIDPGTFKDRKQEIEVQIQTFQRNANCLEHCLYFLKHTKNQYVYMCCLNILEYLVKNKWQTLSQKDRTAIGLFSWGWDFTCNIKPSFARNKQAKLIVEVARNDWPHLNPNFFTNILKMLSNPDTRILGLIVLKTACEELVRPRDDVVSSRRSELFNLMQTNILSALTLLTELLKEIALKKQELRATRTPPPSPVHQSLSVGETITAAAQVLSSGNCHNSREISTEILYTLQHIFTWVNISSIPTSLIGILFEYATAMSFTQDDDDISILAITVLSELLYRRDIQLKDKTIITQMYEGATQLLVCYSADNQQNACAPFIEKLNQFIELLVEFSYVKVTSETNLDNQKFLEALFRYTFEQRNVENFLFCIGTWKIFLTYPKHQSNGISELITGLTNGTFSKILFEKNFKELNEINFEALTFDDGFEEVIESEKTDFEYFINKCANFLSILAEYGPLDILNMLLFVWQQHCQVYTKLTQFINTFTFELNLNDSNESMQLLVVIQDLATISRCLSHISARFSDEESPFYVSSFPIIKNFINQLTAVLLLMVDQNIFKVKTIPKRLDFAFKNLHTNLLMCLTSWCLWPGVLNQITDHALADKIAKISVALITDSKHTHVDLVTQSVRLLVRFVNVAPISFLHEQAAITQLLPFATIGSVIDDENANDLRFALCNMVALTNPRKEPKTAELRAFLLKEMRNIFLQPLAHLDSDNINHVKHTITTVLPRLSSLISQYDSHDVVARKAVSSITSDPLDKVLEAFSKYSEDPDIRENVLSLLYTVCKIFIINLHSTEKRKFVEIIIEVTLRNSNTNSELIVCGLDKLLKIFALLVAEYDVRYLHSNIVDFCLKKVLPLLIACQWQLTDVCYAFYEVLHQSVYYCWNQFYKSSAFSLVQDKESGGLVNCEEKVENEERFISILQAFGEALLQSDFNIFRISLKSLESINERWRLYEKQVFRTKLMCHFLTALLNSLLNKTHAILNEEILQTIYQMAQVDLKTFVEWFLPNYLATIDGLSMEQKKKLLLVFGREMDEPTVKGNISQLVMDLRCYCIGNSNQTQGAVLFS